MGVWSCKIETSSELVLFTKKFCLRNGIMKENYEIG